MKRLFIGGLVLAGIIAFAGTCTLQNSQLTTIGANDTFAGEIHNDTGANFLGHTILVAFIDANGNVLETKTVTPCLRSVQNGMYTFFSATSSQPAANTTIGLARFAFDGTLKVGSPVPGNVSLSNIVVTRYGTSLHVRGTVRNNDSTTLDNPNVCAVVYSNTGNVVVVGQDTTIVTLNSNQSDTFDIRATVPDSATTVDHIDLWTDGFENNVPIVPESVLGRTVPLCSATVTPTPTGSATPTATNTPPPPTATNTPTGATQTAIALTGTATSTATSAAPVATATSICANP